MSRIFTDPRVDLIDAKWYERHERMPDEADRCLCADGMIADLRSLGYSDTEIIAWNEARKAARKARH